MTARTPASRCPSAGRGTASAERTRVSAASHSPAAVSVLTVVAVRADRSGSDGRG